MREAGVLDRSLSFYLPLTLFSFGGYALSIAAIIAWQGYVELLLACLGMSFFTVQLAGLMHDSGHRAVFGSTRLNNWLGFVSSASIGMVFANWRTRHNLHHSHPNEKDCDPDMEVPFLVLDPLDREQKDVFQRFITRWQAFYYYPLGAIVGVTNRLGSLSHFLKNPSASNLALAAVYLLVIILLFAGPFLLFPLPKAVFVVAVTQITTGIYLASCFAPNHKGMTTFLPSDRVSFLEQQVASSRNVAGGPLTTLLLVGLNYQIEHHLFPTCPRNKLARLEPFVRETCAARGLQYSALSFLGTNRELVMHLHRASRIDAVPSGGAE